MSTKERGARMVAHSDTSLISLDSKSKDTTLNLTKKVTFNNLCEKVLPLSDPKLRTEYKVTNIRHEVPKETPDYNRKQFTLLRNNRTAKGMKSVSLNEVVDVVNSFSNEQITKDYLPCFLKGIYKKYYRGEHCIETSPFLFFDIDVRRATPTKPAENEHLISNKANNSKVFYALEKIAVLVWRSKSGNGIAGVLWVPQIEKYLHKDKDKHKRVGEAITEYLSEYLHKVTGVERVKFDDAQSAFRQVRNIAVQHTKRTINKNPFVFYYDSKDVALKTNDNVPLFKPDYNNSKTRVFLSGSIFAQFNKEQPILPLMLASGQFHEVGTNNTHQVRVKHDVTTSTTSGTVDTVSNLFIYSSQSLQRITDFKGALNAAQILYYFYPQYENDWHKIAQYIRTLGYENKPITPTELHKTGEAIRGAIQQTNGKDIEKVIYSYCVQIQHATTQQKHQFINDNCHDPKHRKYFIEYLKLADYTIKYNATLKIDNWISEQLPNILSYADQHHHIVLSGETGDGKTFAFVDEFIKLHPNKRILILAPLTIIVDQNREKYKQHGSKYAFLTGSDNIHTSDRVQYASVVFATYEQGSNWIAHKNHNFDYIVVDEIHQLLTANSYKLDTIAKLTPLLKNNTVIGLTGTPSQVFSLLDYKILRIEKRDQNPTPIEIRYSNTKAYNIALNHLRIRPKGKTLMRINSIDTIHELTDKLVQLGVFKRSEILHLFSTKEIKNGTDYRRLAHKGKFADRYTLVITTSLIEEGVSINQSGFSDVVFIDTDYNPRPEAIKQFFARFRNEDNTRQNIAYLRQKTDQTPTSFKVAPIFNDDLKALERQSKSMEGESALTTYKHIFSNNDYFYNDGNINKYYLAFATSNILFQRMNVAQYVEYLEANYNLSITINVDYKIEKKKANTGTTLEKRQQIAHVWTAHQLEVMQALRDHTQDVHIRRSIHPQMIRPELDVLNCVLDNIKEFEKLFKRTERLRSYNVSNPNDILINSEVTPIKLNSNTAYKNEILYQTIERTLTLSDDEATPQDKRTKQQFIKFAQWCVKEKSFLNIKMTKRLKGLGILKSKRLNEDTLFKILRMFNLDVRKDTNTKIIHVTEIKDEKQEKSEC